MRDRLTYVAGQPNERAFQFTREKNDTVEGYLVCPQQDQWGDWTDNDRYLTLTEVEALRDMLNEVLEDWK
jgi:hypothetical protein